jgi:uncharacterized caspase-like protein
MNKSTNETISMTNQDDPEHSTQSSTEIKNNEPRCALVIGNSRYEQKPLNNPVNDATAIASKLKNCGFEVILRTDQHLSDFNHALYTFGIALRKNNGGVDLVFYSGHGIQINGDNYLLPIDFRATEEADAKGQAIQADRLLEHMESAGCNLNILIFDACRDNPLPSRMRSLTRGLAVMSSSSDSMIIYATEPNGKADDGDMGGNSPFTSALLDVLDIPNIPVEQSLKLVTKKVHYETKGKQRPWANQSLISDFIFLVADKNSPKDTKKTFDEITQKPITINDDQDKPTLIHTKKTINEVAVDSPSDPIISSTLYDKFMREFRKSKTYKSFQEKPFEFSFKYLIILAYLVYLFVAN